MLWKIYVKFYMWDFFKNKFEDTFLLLLFTTEKDEKKIVLKYVGYFYCITWNKHNTVNRLFFAQSLCVLICATQIISAL